MTHSLPPLRDEPVSLPVQHRRQEFTGRVWDVVSETVTLTDGPQVQRDFVAHPGAVAIFALNKADEVFLVRQYRHPVRHEVWEPPAGLLDIPGEDPLVAAQRELFEEADLRAHQWHILQDFFTSPGGSAETIRIYLARDLIEVPVRERFARSAEEALMAGRWVPLSDLLAAIATGEVHGPTLIVGAYALAREQARKWQGLRAADAPWPELAVVGRRLGAGDR